MALPYWKRSEYYGHDYGKKERVLISNRASDMALLKAALDKVPTNHNSSEHVLQCGAEQVQNTALAHLDVTKVNSSIGTVTCSD